MADYTEEDILIQDLDILTLSLITLIPGLVIHSFIIGVNVNDWWKGRSVTSVDHIVTSLGISRMVIQCALTIYLFVNSFFESSQQSYVIMLFFTTAYSFFTYTNIWLTSLLSIVFCLKISTLRTRLFLYLRRMILPRTGCYIVASGLLSAITCFIYLWKHLSNVMNDESYNTTMDTELNDKYIAPVFYFTIGSSIPVFFLFISSILLFTSLYHHTVKMKKSSNLSIDLETYYSVMKFVSFTFIYNIIYFFGLFALIFCSYLYGVSLSCVHIIFGFLPVLHSYYLIYRTAKLRSQMSEALQSFIDLLFPRKSTESRDTIELVAQ
ncbi:taste receptor type 2 member 4-like [Anomaloglossus baeobatrachus]|uniref:taste receptor type 2 member 4-like n=1 Tax=Anomaloglossus baeobatrachus TaxID=238106 RepID=UPI003F4FBA6B